jgi:hypothetical protein
VEHVVGAAVGGEDDLAHLRLRHELEQPQAIRRDAKRLRRGLPERPFLRAEGQNLRQDHRQIRLVEGASRADQVAQVTGGAFTVADEAVGRARIQPAAGADQPARRGEVVKGDHRLDAVFVTGRQHAPVMVERGQREFAFLRLDARPLDGEAIGVEAQLRQQRNIFRVAVVMVAGVARRLGIDRAGQVLQHPAFAVDVVAFDLMGSRGRAPQKTLRESVLFHAIMSFSVFFVG